MATKYKLNTDHNGNSYIDKIITEEFNEEIHSEIMTIVTKMDDNTKEDKSSIELMNHAKWVVNTLNQAEETSKIINFVKQLVDKNLIESNPDLFTLALNSGVIKISYDSILDNK